MRSELQPFSSSLVQRTEEDRVKCLQCKIFPHKSSLLFPGSPHRILSERFHSMLETWKRQHSAKIPDSEPTELSSEGKD